MFVVDTNILVYAAIAQEALDELAHIRGNLVFDMHTAILMKEHGIAQICTRNTDFRRFPFVKVIDPILRFKS